MGRFFNGLLEMQALACQRDLSRIRHALVRRAWSVEEEVGLRRDLTAAFSAPRATIPIRLRPATNADLRTLLNPEEPGLSRSDRWDRHNRLRWFRQDVGTAFVAVTDDDQPCFVQWLITPEGNDSLRRSHHPLRAPLEADEMLLEGAYTPAAFRGQRIMPAGMALVAEQAAALGARGAVTFVGVQNIPALKGCQRAGFTPFLAKRVEWRLAREHVTFQPHPPDVAVSPNLLITVLTSPEVTAERVDDFDGSGMTGVTRAHEIGR